MYLFTTIIFFTIFVVFTIAYVVLYSLWSLIEFIFNNTVGRLL